MPADHDDSIPDDADDRDDTGGWDGSDHDAVFTLGRRADDLSPEEQDGRHRSKRFALGALAAVVVIVAVAITLVALLVDTSGGPPASPSAAAQAWASDVVRGDHTDQRRLECDDAQSADVLLLILTAPTAARAGTARRSGNARWSVPVTFDDAGQSNAVRAAVTVVRQDGRYLVC